MPTTYSCGLMRFVWMRCSVQNKGSCGELPHGQVVNMAGRAFIVGDSQAQGAGAFLQKRLERDGWLVDRSSKHGAGSAEVLKLAEAQAGERYDLVVVFSGSTAGGAPAAKQIPKLFSTAKIYWYGSGPATTIKNLSTARAVFGKKVTDAQYWFESGEAGAREQRNAEMPTLLPPSVQYVDWRSLTLPDAVIQPSGVTFPNLNDGIHVTGATAQAAFEGSNWPPPEPFGGLQIALWVGAAAIVYWAWRRGFL